MCRQTKLLIQNLVLLTFKWLLRVIYKSQLYRFIIVKCLILNKKSNAILIQVKYNFYLR